MTSCLMGAATSPHYAPLKGQLKGSPSFPPASHHISNPTKRASSEILVGAGSWILKL